MKLINKLINKSKTFKVDQIKIAIVISIAINLLLLIKVVAYDQDKIQDPKIDVQVILKSEQLLLDENQVVYDSNDKIVRAKEKVNKKLHYKLEAGKYEIVSFNVGRGEAEIIMLYVKK